MALYPNTEVIILCAALDDPTSLDNLTKKWMDELRSAHVNKRPLIMVLTKSDLRSDDTSPTPKQLINSAKVSLFSQAPHVRTHIHTRTWLFDFL